MPIDVLRLAGLEPDTLTCLLRRYGLELEPCASGARIPGSFWGDCEAGLIGNALFARDDTPLHSILHETAHFICLDAARRAALDTDAGSDDAEESAVCYLQVLLADEIPGCDRDRIFRDMDAWGYSFRLGSSRAWFENDAEDARNWLICNNLIDEDGRLTFRRRD